MEGNVKCALVNPGVGGGTPTRFGGFQPSPLDRVQGSTSYLCCALRVDRQGRFMPDYSHDAPVAVELNLNGP
jgi:hypothetical protein